MKNRSKTSFYTVRSPRRTFRDSAQIKNPLLRLWNKHQKDQDPEKIFEFMNDYSYSILDTDTLDFLKRYSPIIEIGARNGYLTYILRQVGIEVIAFDPQSTEKSDRLWSSVKLGGERYVKYYPHHNLLLNWPPANSELAYHTIRNFNEASKANFVIIIGEYRNNKIKFSQELRKKGVKYTMGTKKFYNYLEKYFVQVAVTKLPNWKLTSSKLFVFERQNKILH